MAQIIPNAAMVSQQTEAERQVRITLLQNLAIPNLIATPLNILIELRT